MLKHVHLKQVLLIRHMTPSWTTFLYGCVYYFRYSASSRGDPDDSRLYPPGAVPDETARHGVAREHVPPRRLHTDDHRQEEVHHRAQHEERLQG